MVQQDILNFIERHKIPGYALDFSEFSEKQMKYEEQIFCRRTGGSSMRPEPQYENGESSAKKWKEHLGDRKAKILDVGCGEGYVLYFLEKRGFDCYGINLSIIETELARHGIPNPDSKIMEWTGEASREVDIGSALDLPYPDGSFDGVACYGMLMMVPRAERIFHPEKKFSPLEDAKTAISEIGRVLKPGCRLHLVTMKNSTQDPERTEDYIGFDERAHTIYDAKGRGTKPRKPGIIDLLEEAGMKMTEMKPVHNKKDFWSICADKE